MSIFNFFRPSQPKSAETAKERLQILLAHERANRESPDYLPMMQKEIIAVIAKYMEVDEDKVAVKVDRNGDTSMLELNIELPRTSRKPKKRGAAAAASA
jgi:cell division topological specificity factor